MIGRAMSDAEGQRDGDENDKYGERDGNAVPSVP
jgi:hypothetical protein